RRTRRCHDAFRCRRKGAWSRSRKWADCIIGTNDAPRDGQVDRRVGIDPVYVCLRGDSLVRVPRRFGRIVSVTASAQGVSAVSATVLLGAFETMAHSRGAPVLANDNHRTRTHLGLAKDAPEPRLVSDMSTRPIIAIPEVGGLHHRYERQAAYAADLPALAS